MTQEGPAFFSYSREDSDFALKLAEDLKAAGANVWLDQLDIRPGERWDRAVEDALTNSHRMVVLLSPASVKSINVMDEVSFALGEQKAVIPVIIRECMVPFRLRRVQHVDFRRDYMRGLQELLKALALGQALLQNSSAISEGGSPSQSQRLNEDEQERRKTVEIVGTDTEHKQVADGARLGRELAAEVSAEIPRKKPAGKPESANVGSEFAEQTSQKKPTYARWNSSSGRSLGIGAMIIVIAFASWFGYRSSHGSHQSHVTTEETHNGDGISGGASDNAAVSSVPTPVQTRSQAELRIFLPSPDWDPVKAPPQQAKVKFAGFDWVDDPSLQPVQFYVTFSQGQWKAFDNNGAEVTPVSIPALAAQGKPHKAFLALPPTAKMVTLLQNSQDRMFEFVPSVSISDYLLVGREEGSGQQYSLLRSDFMGPRPATGYDESTSPEDTGSSVVCGHDRSLPVRSEWVPVDLNARESTTPSFSTAKDQLQAIAARLAGLRGWMLFQASQQPSGFWPYHLTAQAQVAGSLQAITSTSLLYPKTTYELSLQANPADLSVGSVVPLFVYVIGIDCSGRTYLLYPQVSSNGGSPQPSHATDGTYPTKVILGRERVGPPYGADSIFLVATPERITNLRVAGDSRTFYSDASSQRFLVQSINIPTSIAPRK